MLEMMICAPLGSSYTIIVAVRALDEELYVAKSEGVHQAFAAKPRRNAPARS